MLPPCYIGRNSLNRPPLRIARQYQRNLYIVEKYFQCVKTPSLTVKLSLFIYPLLPPKRANYRKIRRKFDLTVFQGHPRVDDFGTTRKRIYEFLLVINSNLDLILHPFWDTATYWLKVAYCSYPSLIRRSRSLSSLSNCTARFSVRKPESWSYSVLKVAWS